jgi:dihydrolipoamide dehydrogenase
VSVAIVEKSEWGGTCLNRGCIPTKTLLHEACHWNHIADSGLMRNREEIASYFKYTLEKKNAAVNQVVSGVRKILNRDHITSILGEACFINPRTLSIKRDGKIIKRLESDQFLLHQGSTYGNPPKRWTANCEVMKLSI